MAIVAEGELGLKPDLRGFESNLKGSLGKVAGAAAGIFAGAFAAIKVGSFFRGAISEAIEAANVIAQTGAVIKSTGGIAGITAEHVDKLATKLSELTGVDDELIAQGENVLLTFTNIRDAAGKGNDVFTQATTLALDMSKALGTDLQGSIIQVGKALNDPIKGVTALQRVGVSFTEQQKEQIKVLTESGDVLGAQKVVLAELSKEFGGVAEAVATPIEKLKVVFKNLQEDVGGAILPVLNALTPALSKIIESLTPILVTLGDEIGKAFVALEPAFGDIITSLGLVVAAITPLLGPIAKLIAAWVSLLPPIAKLASKIIEALLPAFIPLIDAVAQVYEKIGNQLGKVVQQLVDSGTFDDLATAFVQISEALLPLVPAFGDLVIAALPMIPALVQLVTLVAQFIAAIPPPVLLAIVGGIILLNSEFVAFVAVAALVVAGLRFVVDHFDLVTGAARAVIDFIRDHWPLLLAILTGPIGLAVLAISRHFDKIKDVASGLGRVLGSVWDGFKSAFSTVIDFIRRVWNNTIGGKGFKLPGILGGAELRIPRLHSGGVFQAPFGQNQGFALLRNDEVVFTPEQVRMFARREQNQTTNITVIDNTGDPEHTAAAVSARLGMAAQR